VLGCSQGVKWDSRQFLESAVNHGARLITGCKAERIIIENGNAKGVQARQGWRTVFYPADLVILAAGGLGTPVILQNSGISGENNLFVDPVLCVAAQWDKCFQNKEISMPFVVQKEHFILSPYFDFLSFFFNKNWKYPAANIVSLMIKLADVNTGSISGRTIDKPLTDIDKDRLNEGVELCSEILGRLGIKRDDIFLGTINAGHPGGMMPLSEQEAGTLHNNRLPKNVYIADATLFPVSLGNPPILTIMALAKRISKLCAGLQ
jgi:choline dehydrogenase-like flavoprotein